MGQLRIMTLFGTRAEVIKMAPIIKLMKQDPDTFEPVIVVASKQYQQLHQAMSFLGIESDFDLNVKSSAEIGMIEQLSQLLHNVQTVISAAQPDMLMVLGDTITTLSASLTAFYNQIPVAHVEAGLRTYDKLNPFPDEMQRHLTDTLSDVFFAPTEQARENLINESIAPDRIFVTGNTIVDTVTQYYDPNYQSKLLDTIPENHEFALLTMGRVENTGLPMERVFRTMRDVIETNPNLELICPVATASAAFGIATEILSNRDRIHVLPLMDLGDFLNTAARSKFILTDSAGTVEEASFFHKPVLLLRKNTERQEAIQAGTAKVVGTDPTSIQQAVFSLLNDKKYYNQMTSGGQIFGDGHAADKIVDIIKREF